ncbi:hypothetical protein Hgul01_02251 [Herpetosiphon gulosus]|uniref:Uncharacterized protein n=1 Tax=Herpetosiphon gulosus TaxID=1973496 RepID=A0ABP9WZ91_9CHLR
MTSSSGFVPISLANFVAACRAWGASPCGLVFWIACWRPQQKHACCPFLPTKRAHRLRCWLSCAHGHTYSVYGAFRAQNSPLTMIYFWRIVMETLPLLQILNQRQNDQRWPSSSCYSCLALTLNAFPVRDFFIIMMETFSYKIDV